MRKSLFFYAFLLSFFLIETINAQVWQPLGNSTGISTGNAGRQTLICDGDDNLIVGYYDAVVLKGSVQKYNWTGGNWDYIGGAPGITPGTTTYNSLSVDSQGNIFFLNQAVTPAFGHEVRKFENGTWTELPKVTNSIINFNASAVSSDDILFAINNENNGTVKKFVNGAWQQVGATGFTGGVPYFLDMVIGSNGKIYVSFNNNGYLHVYENNINANSTDVWQPVGGVANLAPAPNTEDYNSSLAIDSQNNLFVAYVSNGAGGNKLNVKKFDGTTWSQLGNENFTTYRVKHTSIAIGANDIVYVAVSNWEDANMLRNYVMAYNETDNTWAQAGTGFASEGQGIFNSLTVDSFGNLFMSYTDSGLEKLIVKRLNLNIVAAASIEITTEGSAPAEINVDNGTLQLNAAVLPVQASQDIVWSIISGETFATVDQNGLVTAIASNAVITVKAHSPENTSIFNTIDIAITNQDSDVDAIEVKVETADGGYPDILALGNTLQLVSSVLPVEADQDVVWSIQNENSVISIDQNGLVTALTEGSATVKVMHKDGVVYDEILVNVWENGCTQGTLIDVGGLGYNVTANSNNYGADDFIVAEGVHFEVSKLRLQVITQSPEIEYVNLNFIKNNIDRPGNEVLVTVENIVPTAQKFIASQGIAGDQYEIELDLPEPVGFNQGTYWLSPEVAGTSGANVYWVVTNDTNYGHSYKAIIGQNAWIPLDGFDGSFEITGNCSQMPVIISTVNGEDTEILVGETVGLQAETTGESQQLVWTIESGDEFITLEGIEPIITGIEPGVAKVRVTLADSPEYYDEIEITVLNPDACGQEVLSNNLENGYELGAIRLAVDIDVEEGTQFTIHSVVPTTVSNSTYFSFTFYEDNNGFPGSEITTVEGDILEGWVTGDNFNYYFYRYTVALETPVVLTPGKYWMQLNTDAIAWEATSASVLGHPGVFDNGSGWVYTSNGSEYVYSLIGECEEYLSTTDLNAYQFSYYPNPVKDELNLNSQKKVQNIEIFNLAGQKVNQVKLNVTNGKVSTSNLSAGIYLFRATLEGGQVETFKIVKK